jgi:cell division protein FtsB
MRRVWVSLIALCAGVVAFSIYGQAAQSHALDAQAAELRQQNSALQQQITERQQQVIEAQTTAWLEEEARKLGYVLPGERVFVLTGPGSSPPAEGGVAAPLPTFTPPTPLPTPTSTTSPKASPTPLQFGGASPSPTPG